VELTERREAQLTKLQVLEEQRDSLEIEIAKETRLERLAALAQERDKGGGAGRGGEGRDEGEETGRDEGEEIGRDEGEETGRDEGVQGQRDEEESAEGREQNTEVRIEEPERVAEAGGGAN